MGELDLHRSVHHPMASQAYVGLAVTSHNNGTLSTAVFDNVTVVSQGSSPPGAAPLGAHRARRSNITASSITLSWNASSPAPTAWRLLRLFQRQHQHADRHVTTAPLPPSAGSQPRPPTPSRSPPLTTPPFQCLSSCSPLSVSTAASGAGRLCELEQRGHRCGRRCRLLLGQQRHLHRQWLRCRHLGRGRSVPVRLPAPHRNGSITAAWSVRPTPTPGPRPVS